ncbi:putative lumazine-binding protein [Tenacibaculum skagerrakense]|uniref:Putative lumazine-binding protein n=1 Tax=Tenacibaculum skagerrakense TaxID=186571 RepID=A0A4R2P126_9FLAO|nr:nuclear transport factor 2 family protein [Tenacibaculum skagerrakense]TCP28242.1 putative lumazine-binding protein [Tenacibaculum skagerrakense]
MRKLFTLLFCIFLSTYLQAQNTSEESTIKTVIDTFFEGLHAGDSSIVSKTLHADIKIQTTFTNKEGVKVLRDQKRDQLLKGIAGKKKEDVYFEKLLSYDIKIDGNLASVWTPYEFYFNDKFSHCGANSFQLFNNNGKWEIIYLVDMRKRAGCKVVEEKK